MTETRSVVTWRSTGLSAAELGLWTGLGVAGVDAASALGSKFAGDRSALVIYIFSLVMTTCTAVGALLGSWVFVGRRLAAYRSHGRAVWSTSAWNAVPLVVAALYPPLSWTADHLSELSSLGSGVAALLVLAISGCTIVVWLGRGLARQRSKAPRPASRLRRATLAALAAAASVGCYVADATVYPDQYAEFHDGLFVAFAATVTICVALIRELLLEHRPSARRFLQVGAFGLAAASAGSLVVLDRLHVDVFDPSRAVAFTKLVQRWRALADIDGDGHAAILGGRDCAPFDANRSPREADIPENGVDEDCSGKDARWPVAPPPPRPAAAGTPKHNVLLITVDTLRADHMGTYGYHRPTSPNLDRLADESIVFTRAFAQSSRTLDSVPSFLSGFYPSNLSRIGERPLRPHHPKRDAELVAETFLKHGYSTSAVVWFPKLRTAGVDRGFQHFRVADPTREAKRLLRKATPPFMIWLHYQGPHAPYHKRAQYDFGDSDIDRYDSEIAAEDARIGQVLAALSAGGFADSTIVIVSADHGEEFGEHGGQYHTRKHYRELLHVPLIIGVPGVRPARISEVVELVDIVPTLHELCGFAPSRMRFDGQNLLDTLNGPRSIELGGAYSEDVHHLLGVRRRALFDGRYRFIEDHVLDRRELYDTQNDPLEQRNVRSAYPEVAERMRERISVRTLRSRSPRHADEVYSATVPATQID